MASCPLSDIELESVLSGEADPVADVHVRDCEVCRSRLAELAHDELPLRHILFRAVCPASEELAKWYLGWLDDETADRVQRHVQQCSTCQEEVNIQAEILDLPLQEVPGDADSVQRIVAHPVSAVERATDLCQSEYVYRGSASVAGRRYRADDIDVILDVKQRSTVRYRVVGFIKHSVDRIGQFDGAAVVLKKDGRMFDKVHVDDVDTFLFPSVLREVYTMEIHLGAKTVVIERLGMA